MVEKTDTGFSAFSEDAPVFTTGKSITELQNNIIEAIEEGLDVDRKRGGNALDTQIRSIEIDEGSIDPIGGVIMTIRVLYQYTRGTT